MGMEKIVGFFRSADGEKPDLRVRAALILGAAAMLLILLSDMISCDKTTAAPNKAEEYSSAEYTAQLEQRLGEMISRVDGAGETAVMLTLESGAEYIYASEEVISTEQNTSSGGDGRENSGTSSDSKSSYIVIEGENGEQALVRTQLMPRISGVIILCEGADDPKIAQSVKELAATALGISTRRVCVARLSG